MLVGMRRCRNQCSQYLIEQIQGTKNVKVRLRTTVVRCMATNASRRSPSSTMRPEWKETVPTNALFIFIGAVPPTEFLKGVVERAAQGYILTGPDLAGGGGDRAPAARVVARPRALLARIERSRSVRGGADVRHGSVKKGRRRGR